MMYEGYLKNYKEKDGSLIDGSKFAKEYGKEIPLSNPTSDIL
jgi:hypothetical protein